MLREEKGLSYFEFEMNGKTYQILSVNSPAKGQPYNQLIGDDFIAIDIRQNQNIDKVLIGDPNKIDEYMKIYKHGIQQALEKGKLKEKEDIFSYNYSTSMKYFNVITYFPARGNPHNEFIYIEAFTMKRVIKAIDRNADGKLDIITSGFYDMNRLQKEYLKFLKNGISKNRIAYKNGMYLVIPQD